MSANLTLEIVTPQRKLLEVEADYVTLPGGMGELGILPGHIPIVTTLQSGVLSYKSSNDVKKMAVHYGYAEVCKDKITILANAAELSSEIKLEASKAAQKKAEEELADALKDTDKASLVQELQEKIKMEVTRQSVVQ